MCKKLKWRTEPLPDDELVVLFQADVKIGNNYYVDSFVGFRDDWDNMITELGDETGYKAYQVSRWIPFYEIEALIEE